MPGTRCFAPPLANLRCASVIRCGLCAEATGARVLRRRSACAQARVIELAMKGKGDCAYSLTCVTSFSKMVDSMGRCAVLRRACFFASPCARIAMCASAIVCRTYICM